MSKRRRGRREEKNKNKHFDRQKRTAQCCGSLPGSSDVLFVVDMVIYKIYFPPDISAQQDIGNCQLHPQGLSLPPIMIHSQVDPETCAALSIINCLCLYLRKPRDSKMLNL